MRIFLLPWRAKDREEMNKHGQLRCLSFLPVTSLLHFHAASLFVRPSNSRTTTVTDYYWCRLGYDYNWYRNFRQTARAVINDPSFSNFDEEGARAETFDRSSSVEIWGGFFFSGFDGPNFRSRGLLVFELFEESCAHWRDRGLVFATTLQWHCRFLFDMATLRS